MFLKTLRVMLSVMLREKSLYLIYKGNIIGITCKACLI